MIKSIGQMSLLTEVLMNLDFYAWAQDGGAGPDSSAGLLSLIPFLLIFVVFYFLLILPQQRRQKKQRELLDSLKKGDKVITSSGIWGTVTNLDKETATLQVADNTKIRLQRDHIASIRTSNES